MRIAHLSDLHLLDLDGVSPFRLLTNKRLTGMVNLRMKRDHKHKPEVVAALIEDLRATKPDHVIISGDLTNLALAEEIALAKKVIERLEMKAEDITVVPGNHDVYTGGSVRTDRFFQYFREYVSSDVPNPAGHRYPFVRLRGPAAIVGLSSAIARLPLVSSGWLGGPQLESLRQLLAHDEVTRRTPVVVAHHPVINPEGLLPRLLRGLGDAAEIRALLGHGPHTTLSLHGHLHHRGHAELRGNGGERLHILGATSASLLDHDPAKMGGYNVYELTDTGALRAATARVYNPGARDVVDQPSLGPSPVWRG